MFSLWDHPWAIGLLAFVAGTAFALLVYADDGVEALIYGVFVGAGGYLGARMLRPPKA